MLSLGIAAALAVTGLSQAQPAPAQNGSGTKVSAQAHAGEAIFQHNCMQCHAVLAGQYSFGPNLSAEMKKPHPKKTPTEEREILKNGKGKMPAFGEKLTAPDTDSLIAYLQTL